MPLRCHNKGVLLEMFCQDSEGFRMGCGWEWIVAVIVGFEGYGSFCTKVKLNEELLHSIYSIGCICEVDLRTIIH
jgi:hypothetical protein